MNKRGRPQTKFGNYDPPRILGRINDEMWSKLKEGAQASGKSFSEWAIQILDREAQKAIDSRKSHAITKVRDIDQ